MSAVNPIFAIVAILTALATCFFLTKKIGLSPAKGRYASIDGLRGYLAFAVFLHHAAIWYFYLRSGKWTVPPSNLFTHFGQTSVALFFMITGFLFYTKLIRGGRIGIDWQKFFVSRFLRLVPLYLFAMLLLILITIYRSNGVLNESSWVTAKALMKWATFTIFGAPSINGQPDTWIVMAGVTWSLPYEWLFYLALPVVAMTVRSVPPLSYLLVGVGSFAFAATRGLEINNLLAFGSGIFAALTARDEAMQQVAGSKTGSVLLMACIAAVVALFPTAYGYYQLILISMAFLLIAGGCDLFGLLTNSLSRTLGEMAYSIYLLHGLILFTVINLIVGVEYAAHMSPMIYWLLITGITPVMIMISFTTFTCIEKPSMQQLTVVNAWVSRMFGKRVKESELIVKVVR